MLRLLCRETDKVITAEIVAAGIGVWMSVRGCGSEPYGACPEPSPSPSPDTSSSTSSSSTTSRSPSDSDTSCPYDVSEGCATVEAATVGWDTQCMPPSP